MSDTRQEQLWRGQFGDDYTGRNIGRVRQNLQFFTEILYARAIDYVLELGAGAGENLEAIRILRPGIRLSAVEINVEACAAIANARIACDINNRSLFDFDPGSPLPDLVFTKGVLIHVAPEDLPRAFQTIHGCTSRYILLAEYHSPRLEPLPYRDQSQALWRGPYAEHMMDQYPDLELIATGFASRYGRFPQDDLTWFLMEKTRPRRAAGPERGDTHV